MELYTNIFTKIVIIRILTFVTIVVFLIIYIMDYNVLSVFSKLAQFDDGEVLVSCLYIINNVTLQ